METTKPTRAEALIQFLVEQQGETLTQEEIEEILTQEGEEYTTSYGDYIVLTEDEADEKTDQAIENYIDECVLPEIPEPYRPYFNADAFKSDIYMDGNERGRNIAYYDFNEHEQGEFLIYRTN